jgi:3-oxoacyl-[acyl-carrier protein] reductase
MQLAGKVAIVTGAAVGMGRAIAVALAREGASVAVNYSKSEAEARQTAALITAAGGRALAVRADVAVDAEARALIASTVDAFGRLDILVNNAGITRFIPFKDLEAVPDDIWNTLYDVNVKGAFSCSRAAAPLMRRQGAGLIINIASISGMRPSGSSIPYAVSKAAMIQLSGCLAKALAPEIRVNTVCPGAIGQTRWGEGSAGYDQRLEQTGKSTLMGRAGAPEDVVEAVLFFTTSAHYATGAVLAIDGGLLIA